MSGTYITRALEPLVKRCSSTFKVVVVTGPRQVGKTTMLKHLMREESDQGLKRSYVTLDDTRMQMLAKDDPDLFLQRYKPPVLIDEIQKAPELLPYIKMIVDRSDATGSVWLTGSQPFHLMKEVSESLAGRAVVIEMLGLSNAELTGASTQPFEPDSDRFAARVAASKPMDVLDVYERIIAGGLPAIRTLPDDIRASAYESYLDTYIMRDIRSLTQVGDELRFRKFMTACAALTSKPVVYAELARLADINEKTAKTWLSLLITSYLVKVVQPYSNNLLTRLNKQPIMHFTDTGLAAYLAGWTDFRTLESGAANGQFFETYVFDEIYKSYSNVGQKPPVTFFRNNDRKEIDLLLEKNGTLYPIEVKKTAAPSQGDTKNFPALDPVSGDDIPAELETLKREIGLGCVICMATDTYPINTRAWAYPVWAI